MLTTIQPSKHVIRDTPAAKLFRKKLGFKDIFTFWNAETGEWILAYWVSEKNRLCEELEDLGMAFEKVTPELAYRITTCWKRVDWKAKKQRLVSKERARVRDEVEGLQDEQERWD